MSAIPTVVPVRGIDPYDVIIGHSVGDRVLAGVSESAARVAIIHPPTLRDQAEVLRNEIAATTATVITIEIPDGEKAKTAAVAEYCWTVLGQSGFTRTDVVIGFGGGSTTDVAGFVAATWLRGVPLIQVPTTLLAMVDAAVGGKTGINTAEGKNLVGCFYPPTLVVCDLDQLATLPPPDFVAGLGEVIKCGFIADPTILKLVREDPSDAATAAGRHTAELVERAVRVKADVVSGDLKEVVGGPAGGGIGREVLNYGHTLGHAIERAEGYLWRHGAAISIGMVYAAELSMLAGRLSESTVDLHREVLSSVGLPVTYEAGQWQKLLDAMRLDKKTRADVLRFVVLSDIAKPAILEGPDPAILLAAYDAISS